MSSGTKFLLRFVLFFFFMWFFLKCLFPFLFPFLLGAGLALAAEPFVRPICWKLHLRRAVGAAAGVCFTFLLFGLLLLLLAALLLQGISTFGHVLPDLIQAAASGMHLLEDSLLSLSLRVPSPFRTVVRRYILDFFSDGTAFLNEAGKYILSLAGGVLTRVPDRALTLFTALVSGFMISSRLPELQRKIRETVSGDKIRSILSFGRKLRQTAGHWLLAQLKLSGVAMLILTAGLILLRVPYAPLWAVFIALLDALPVLGTGAVLLPWSLISFLQHSTVKGLGLLALYASAALTRSALEPKFVGKQLGLDPLIALVSIYAGYRLWGFPGMILSPLLAVTAVSLFPRKESPGKSD